MTVGEEKEQERRDVLGCGFHYAFLVFFLLINSEGVCELRKIYNI